MDLTEKVKTEINKRLEKVENFIATKGVGYEYLNRAQKAQRNINIALGVGVLLTAVGITAYVANNLRDSD